MAIAPESLGKSTTYRLEYFSHGRRPDGYILRWFASLNRTMRDKKQQYQQHWEKHIQKSRAFIRDTAQGLTGNALILGLGNGMEIPLEELATQFDTLTIVDIDLESVKETLSMLPESLVKKCRVIIDDLTGTVSGYAARLDQARKAGGKISEFIKAASEAANAASPTNLPIDGEYSFVSSSLVLTQLGSMLYEVTKKYAREYYGAQDLTPTPDTLPFFEALTKLSIKFTQDHISLLRKAVIPQGRVYFSDTISEVYLTRNPITQQIQFASQPLTMIDPRLLMGEINKGFNVSNHGKWIWYRQPPPTAILHPTQGSAFSVEALSLVPKV